MNPRKIAEQELKDAGMVKHSRTGGNHDLWIDPDTREMIPLSRSSHFSTDDLKRVRSELRSIQRRRSARP